MKVNINLHYNNAYKWYNKNDIYAIGYAIKDNIVIKEEQLVDCFCGMELNQIIQELKQLQGYFSIVIKNIDKVYIIADRIRSFPVFYSIKDGECCISDDIYSYNESSILDDSQNELKKLGYVTGDKTLYKDVYQVQNSEVVIINDDSISKEKYFEYNYSIKDMTEREIIIQLDKLYDKAIKNLIKYLDGRRAVLPLSGGHDSRLIAYYLKLNGYNNIIVYTYGAKNNIEAEISKKVAEYLGIEWKFVEYKSKSMRKKYKNKHIYGTMADYCGRGFSVPIIQEWEAINYLLSNNIISKNDVIVPGYSGDFIAGSHLVSEKEIVNLDVSGYIAKKHYCLDRNAIDYISTEMIKRKTDVSIKTHSIEECQNAIEKFDYEERQTKFISNAVRIYDYQGLQWYMPFWDVELLDYWITVPLQYKYNRNVFERFTQYKYSELMQKVPIAKVGYKAEKLKASKISKIKRLFENYFKHYMNYYRYLSYTNYLRYSINNLNTNYYSMFTADYIRYINQK